MSQAASALESLLIVLPRMAFRRHAVRALAASLEPQQAARVWEGTLRSQRVLARERPSHSAGTNLLLRYMEWDCALYRTMREQGIAQDAALALVEDINWRVFAPVTHASFGLSRLRSPDLLTRVRWLVDLMFRVVFTAPFRRTSVASDAVAFDVVACPLAAYFRDRGHPELTAAAACSLDHRMADLWGMTLRRTQTIAQGDPRCDFRFSVKVVARTAPGGAGRGRLGS